MTAHATLFILGTPSPMDGLKTVFTKQSEREGIKKRVEILVFRADSEDKSVFELLYKYRMTNERKFRMTNERNRSEVASNQERELAIYLSTPLLTGIHQHRTPRSNSTIVRRWGHDIRASAHASRGCLKRGPPFPILHTVFLVWKLLRRCIHRTDIPRDLLCNGRARAVRL